MKLLSRATEWVRTHGQSDTAISHALQFAYRVFGNIYVQTIISFLGTTLISILTGFHSFGIFLWICIFLYFIFTIFITWANSHVRGKVKDVKAFQHALYGMGTSLRSWALSLERATRLLKKGNISAKNFNLENLNINFETAASLVCETLCSSLSRKDERDDVYVTLYKRIDVDKCQMIAHSLNYEPPLFDYENAIPKPCNSAAPSETAVHSYVLYFGNKGITALHNHDSIMKEFERNGNCAKVRKDIQQYVCIPIVHQTSDIMFLLQVETNIPNFFGDNEKAVKDFAKNIIYHYAQLLHMMYEQSCIANNIVSYIRRR